MLDQISELVKQFGGDAIVRNPSVPNEHNEAVMNETGNSILLGLQNMVAQGNVNDIAGLLNGGNIDASNPVVKQLTEQLSGNLGQKFGLSSNAASDVAGNMIPNVLGSLIGKANDPNQPGFNVSDIVNSIGGGSGLMDAITKYGGQFGLDQNRDGKVDINDATAAVSGKSGGFLSGILSKLFGK
ncbi:hypothetical protein FEDK69T_00910 [Flavobacterium enshiense DK69]|uniref:Uncharacterized protein n=1 Tax=Flavobacterium enshiense DK69 TaxID=1107311 RepID=V6SF83_9FLAO|nr:hypothetical protein [Flavobacterium enshiense]ESU25124.1 hypothetical protein FEDK69T_00910 [Flavobacterium enshiense DK69]KGO96979.1 hypothetical protein Q767_04600 [Flavobacterium enshiense DK69]